MSEKKYIGIDQRIPMAVLENAVIYLLRGELRFKEEILRDLNEHFTGQTRIKKALTIIGRVFNSDLANQLQKDFTEQHFLQLQPSERKAIIFLLLVESYPFLFDLLSVMTKTLRVQNTINITYIDSQLATLYGSNRTMFVAIEVLFPLLIELEVFVRIKKGLYSKCPPFLLYNTNLIHYFDRNEDQKDILESYFLK